MGKIKSAIITAILLAGIVVLAFFATVSYPVPGSNKVAKHNSFISKISLGSDLTGEAVAVLYPEGVISDTDYEFGIPEIPDDESDEKYAEAVKKHDEYLEKYKQFGSVWVEYEAIGADEDDEDFDEYVDEFIKNVARDAKIISKRLGEKEYSSYSVAVRDDFTIVVTVPTGYSYADYSDTEYSMKENSRSDKQTLISNAISRLAFGGELSLRNSEVGEGRDNILTQVTEDVTSYFKSFKTFSRGGTYAVKVNLTKEGARRLADISKVVSAANSDKAIGFYVGENQLLSLNLEESISGNSFYITVNNKAMSVEYATVLNSCIKGEALTYDYGTDKGIDIVYTNAALGDNAAIYLFCSLLAIMLAVIIYSVVRYRMLGFVNAIVVVMFALTLIVAIMLLNIQVTIAGAIFIIAGLGLLVGSNFVVFEKVRGETKKGKTMQSSVKAGYKSLLKGILEMHAVLIAVSLIVALVCVGELAACGMIFFISSVASYVLYWFTRFMWFMVSSTVNDKFAFCGFKREELEDD